MGDASRRRPRARDRGLGWPRGRRGSGAVRSADEQLGGSGVLVGIGDVVMATVCAVQLVVKIKRTVRQANNMLLTYVYFIVIIYLRL